MSEDRHFAAADHQHVRGHCHVDRRGEAVQAEAADREPASRVEQVAGVVADVGQLRPGTGLLSAFSSCPSYSKVRVVEASFARPAGSGTRTVESWVTRSAESA